MSTGREKSLTPAFIAVSTSCQPLDTGVCQLPARIMWFTPSHMC